MAAKKPSEPLSDAAYVKKVKKDDTLCPFCGSTNIEGEGVDVQKAGAQQEVTCQDCCASWYDNYVLTGYTVINGPDTGGDGE